MSLLGWIFIGLVAANAAFFGTLFIIFLNDRKRK